MRKSLPLVFFFAYLLVQSPVLKAQDFIVKTNGDVIEAQVLEIDLNVIRYTRFHQENGPVYTIPKSIVYSIRYHDNTKDIFNPQSRPALRFNQAVEDFSMPADSLLPPEELFMKKAKVVNLGIGMKKIYTSTSKIGSPDFAAQSPFLAASVGIGITNNIVVGFAYGTGKYQATKTITDQQNFAEMEFEIHEKINTFSLWGRYYVKMNVEWFRPYASLGLTVVDAKVVDIMKTFSGTQTIELERGGQVVEMITDAHIGMEFDIYKFGVFSEIGYGPVLVLTGIAYRF